MKEAILYERLEDGKVRCNLCNHRCIIKDGKRGTCGVRENQGGKLVSLVYGRPVATHIDPIEKKPLFHFQPGSKSFSLATVGCNFRCLFCQNADISQMPRDAKRIVGDYLQPSEVVEIALRYNCSSISYTYTEPTIYFEYAYDTGILAKEAGIKNVFVSNGYMTKEALEKYHPNLDAANIDLKSFRDRFYKDLCGARLEPVLDTLKTLKEQDVWVEVTTLIIPGHNDDFEELRDIARFISAELGPETPWHISRFHPTYKLTTAPVTPATTIQRAREIGLEEGLHYVYSGNLPGDEGEKTFCPGCKRVVIDRFGFSILSNKVENGSCPFCKTTISGVEL